MEQQPAQQQQQTPVDIPLDSDRQGWGKSWASKGDEDKMQRYELMGDVRAQDDSMAMSEVIEGLDSGNPLALEQFNLGTSSTGEPIATFRDQFGNMQHIKISTAQWLGVRDQRNNNRKQMAAWEMQQKELAEDKKELRGGFDHGLDSVDSPEFRAFLENVFDENPQAAMAELIGWQRLNAKDAEKAELKVQALMLKQAQGIATSKQDDYDAGVIDFAENSRERYENGRENPELDASSVQSQYQFDNRVKGAMEAAATYGPVPAAARSTVLEALGPRGAVDAYGSWLKSIELGTGNGDSMAIPHPSSLEFQMRLPEIMSQLNSLASSLGWQVPLTEEDYPQILSAIDAHYNVHGEAVRLQQLEEENKKYQEQLKEYKDAQKMRDSMPTGLRGLMPEPEAPTRPEGITSEQPDWQKPDETKVAGIEKSRAKAKATEAAKKGAAQEAAEEKDAKSTSTKNRRMVVVQNDMTELMDGTDDAAGITELRSRANLPDDEKKQLEDKERLYAELQSEWRSGMWGQEEQDEFLLKWYEHLGITKKEFIELYKKGDKKIKEASLKIDNYEDPPPTPASP